MKKLNFALLTLLAITIVACSNTADPRQELYSKAKTNIEAYLNLKFLEEKNVTTLDSISIIQIDTLTELQCLEYKKNALTYEVSKVTELYELEKSILDNYKAMNFEQDIIEHQTKKVNNQLNKYNEIEANVESIIQSEKTADTINFKNYLIDVKIYYNESLSAKTAEIPIILNQGYKVVEWADL